MLQQIFCQHGAIYILDAFFLLLQLHSAVDCVKVEHANTHLHPHLEVNNKQFPSSDIVAQFALPPIAGGVAGGTIDAGGGGSTSTSTEANFGNQTNAANGLGIGSNSQSKNYFTHLTFDYTHNVLYAGATNKILKLNENLRVLSEAVTGPKHDAPQCHAGGCPEDVETALVNNFNKILVVSYAHNDGILISCGSIRQGMNNRIHFFVP